MNSQKIKAGVFLMVVVVLAVGGWYFWKVNNNVAHDSQSPSPITTASTDWKVYENTTYGYKLSYPSDMEVAQVLEMDPHPISEIDDIYIFEPGGISQVSVDVFISYTNVPKEIGDKRDRLIALPLADFAEEVRQNQINDKNPNVKNKRVGELKTIAFAGKTAYSFTLTESFSTDSSGKYGYTIAGTHDYIFVENRASQKIILHYPIGDSISGQIKNSFEFTDK